jgi:hypothetical protein
VTEFGDRHPEVDPDTAVAVMQLAWQALSDESA